MDQQKIQASSVSANSAGRLAMLLAITATRAEEMAIRDLAAANGTYRCAVTEVGGKYGDFRERIFHAVVGAALNSGVIAKTPFQMHALLHATVEAERGMLVNIPGSSSLNTKVAIVTDGKWIAVAIFGVSAFHPLTNHERAGLGVMHLGE